MANADDTDDDALAEDILPPAATFETTAGRAELSAAELTSSELPNTHPMSPMGQVDAMGDLLHTGMRRGGWRRKVVKAYALIPLVAFVVFLLLAVIG